MAARTEPLTQYIQNSGGIVSTPEDTSRPDNIDRQFMHSDIVSLFKSGAGTDITDKLDNLNIDADVLNAQKVCMRNLFFIGKVDNRGSTAVRRVPNRQSTMC